MTDDAFRPAWARRRLNLPAIRDIAGKNGASKEAPILYNAAIPVSHRSRYDDDRFPWS